MLKSLIYSVLLLATPILAQDTHKTIALTDKSTVSAADILKGLQKQCPNVSLISDATKSDYTLEAADVVRMINGTDQGYFALTLFDRAGNAIYSTKTRHVGNAVKDVCHAINAPKGKT